MTVNQSDVTALAQHATSDLLGLIAVDPNADSAWMGVVEHIAADVAAGVLPQSDAFDRTAQASEHFYQAYTNYGQAGDGANSADAPSAAANLVASMFTSSGAAQMLAGLAQQGIVALSGPISNAVQQAAGPLVENAVQHLTGSFLTTALSGAAGAAMASGVGCVVGAGLSILSGFVGHMFDGPPPPPYQIGSCGLYSLPQITVKYVWMWGDPTIGTPIVKGGPNNVDWRVFPDPKADASTWFAGQTCTPNAPFELCFGGHQRSWSWSGGTSHADTWWGCFFFPTDAGKRPIDQAMYDLGYDVQNGAPVGTQEVSVYRQLEWEQVTPLLPGVDPSTLLEYQGFTQLFFHLWKSNREFQINGLCAQPDWKVLQHCVDVWNRARSASSTMTVAPSGAPLLSDSPSVAPMLTNTYVSWLLHTYANQFDPTIMGPGLARGGDGSLTLHTGDLIVVNASQPAGIPHLLPIVASSSKLSLANIAAASSTMWIDGLLFGGLVGFMVGGPLGGAVGAAVGAAAGHYVKQPAAFTPTPPPPPPTPGYEHAVPPSVHILPIRFG